MLSEFNGIKTLTNIGKISYNLQTDKAKKLQEWYLSNKNDLATSSYQTILTIGSVQSKTIKICELTPSFIKNRNNNFKIFGVISYVKITQKYKACKNCNKKLIIVKEMTFTCDKCKQSTKDFALRIIVNFLLTDATGQIWITTFQDKLEKYFRFKFDNQFLENDTELFKCLENLENIPVEIIISSSLQMYSGQERLKHICISFIDNN